MKRYGVWVLLLGVLLAMGCQTSPNVYEIQANSSLFVGAQKGDKVYVDVKNSSTLMGAENMIANTLQQNLTGKGYAIVNSADEADVVLAVNVRYSGLRENAVKAGNILLGAGAGALVGGLGGAALHTHHHHSRNIFGGALLGAVAGGGIAYWMEEANRKNIFASVVDVQVNNKRQNKVSSVTFQATVAEKDLTAQAAAARALPDIAQMVAGQF